MNGKLKDIRDHLPLQKCISGGSVEELSDTELLAVILGTGTRSIDVLDLASGMVKRFGGLRGIHGSGLREMAQCHGLGIKKAIRIRAAFELGIRLLSARNSSQVLDSPERVWRLLQPEMAALQREEFRVFILNNKNSILKKTTVSVGTVTEALVHPREIYREAIREAGASIIVAHNHPSGVLVPSREDIAATKRIKEAGVIIGIELLDHVIIGQSSYLSMKEAGYL
ncbi:MAG TPA: DNA repair protein RadC [Spirochaetota bacterium]|nr:DNA repair protein RadC [Spirochaetota bacterium]